MNPISLIPAALSNNLSIAIVGILVIFFIAVVVARMWAPKASEEVSNGISWKDGKLAERRQRVK